MKLSLRIAAAAIALSLSSVATAAITANPDGSYTIDDNTALGTSFTINFNGQSDGTVIPGLTSSLTLTFQGTSGNNYLFDYDLSNTSGNPVTASTVTGFGFDVDPLDPIVNNPTGGAGNSDVDGTFNFVNSGSISNGFSVEICYTSNNDNSCAGAGNAFLGALFNGADATGSLILAFTGDLDAITLSQFITRYQAITAPGITGGSAVGIPTDGVPEPATWAMMLIGFGAVGYSMRRRRKTFMPQVA
jgi:hypothetical protein